MMYKAAEHDAPLMNADLEEGLVAAACFHPGLWPEIEAECGPDDFADHDAQKVISHIASFPQRRQHVNIELLGHQMRSAGEEDVAAILTGIVTRWVNRIPTRYMARDFAKEIRGLANIRRDEAFADTIKGAIKTGRSQEERDEIFERWLADRRRRVGSSRHTGPVSAFDLLDAHPHLRTPLIEGLLREGETMNLISHSKAGKSWLAIILALCAASGLHWLGQFACEPTSVLLLDNELHKETSAQRVRLVAKAMGISREDVGDRLKIDNVRGLGITYDTLGDYFSQYAADEYKLKILDAHYRFLPEGTDENDNAAMAAIYNRIDGWANESQSAFVLVHHTSKGLQSNKSVTDVGSGAGSQSRATDTHLVLRPHEEQDVFVLEAAVRSWKPVEPRCLRWQFPMWTAEDSLDPSALRQERVKKGPAANDADKDEATLKRIVAKLIKLPDGQTRKWIRENARAGATSINRAIALGLELGQLEECDITKDGKRYDGIRIPAAALEGT